MHDSLARDDGCRTKKTPAGAFEAFRTNLASQVGSRQPQTLLLMRKVNRMTSKQSRLKILESIGFARIFIVSTPCRKSISFFRLIFRFSRPRRAGCMCASKHARNVTHIGFSVGRKVAPGKTYVITGMLFLD